MGNWHFGSCVMLLTCLGPGRFPPSVAPASSRGPGGGGGSAPWDPGLGCDVVSMRSMTAPRPLVDMAAGVDDVGVIDAGAWTRGLGSTQLCAPSGFAICSRAAARAPHGKGSRTSLPRPIGVCRRRECGNQQPSHVISSSLLRACAARGACEWCVSAGRRCSAVVA